MKPILTFLLSVFCFQLWGAAGDYVGAQIDPQGWQLWLEFAGMNTNGTFAIGLGTNNSITGNEKCKVTVVSQGFDDAGAATTITRTLYGTKQLRFPYSAGGAQNFPDTSSNGVNATIKLALSDYIYSGDSNITVTLLSGLYSTNSVNSAAVTAMPVTNNSTANHPVSIANWSWPGFQMVSNSMTLRAVGFHRSGQSGRPLRAMQFVARDQHSHALTNILTQATVDRTMGDQIAVCEYVSTFDVSSFTDGDLVRCDFRAIPWQGNAGSCLDTMDGVNLNAPLYAPMTNWINRQPLTVAVVSVTNNGTGVVVTNFNAASPPVAFSSMAAACGAIVSTNNMLFGRSNAAGSVIYVRAGDYTFAGSGGNGNPNPAAWIHVLPFPNDSTVTFTNQSGNQLVGWYYHLDGICFSWTAGGTKVLFNGGTVWLDNCPINYNGAAMSWNVTGRYITRCAVTNFNTGLTRAYSTVNSPTVLLRGNLIGTGSETGIPYTMLGNNSMATNSAVSFSDSYTSMAAPRPMGQIIAFNKLCRNANFTQSWTGDPGNTTGMACVQNVFEKVSGGGISLLQLGADSSTSSNMNNFLFVNNTVMGERMNWMYNDQTSTNQPNLRKYCLLQNNLFDRFAIVSDKDFHGGGQDARRTNNWSEYYGVGYSGNLIASHPFLGDFSGFNAWIFSGALGSYDLKFITNGSATGTSNGFGNYKISSGADAVLIPTQQYLPYDIEGNARGNFDPPGAYSSSSPRKGGGFF